MKGGQTWGHYIPINYLFQFKKAPSGEDLPDTLKHVKFSSMAWTHDHKGIFYNVSDVIV